MSSDEFFESPLESYSARSVVYARVVIGIALVVVLLFGLLETAVLLSMSFGPRASMNPVVLVIGIIGASSVVLCLWTLWRVRTLPLWKLIAMSVTSMVFAAVGWINVIAGAH